MTAQSTYCCYCSALCGVIVEVEDNRVVKVRGDLEHPMSRGFTCTKGRHIGDFVAAPDRLRESQRRTKTGALAAVTADEAVNEIADRLLEIRERHGGDSIGLYWGTHGVMAPLSRPVANAFWRTIGSHKWYSTMTIDQAPKWVAPGRIGQWQGGRQRFQDSDVWMLVGTNPVLSMLGGVVTGFPQQDGLRRVREARSRGMQLLVVDPRRSETAALADIHLQIVPGRDALLLAGILRIILTEELHDERFCAEHVADLTDLKDAVSDAEPELVARGCGIPLEQLFSAARVFGRGRRGMVTTGTGANMGPHANLVEHLTWCINIVCGRFAREGDPWHLPTVLSETPRPVAEATGPDRSWESGFISRIGDGYGLLFGELPSATLPDEILEPGSDRIRALIVVGGNPAAAIPGQHRVVEALSSLELLVVIDPFLNETAQLADFVLAPAMQLERPQHTAHLEHHIGAPFAQYAPRVLAPPPGVLEDWVYLAKLTHAMGREIEVFGHRLLPGEPLPTSDEMLVWQAQNGRVPLAEVQGHPHGGLYTDLPHIQVGRGTGAGGRFRLLAEDVAIELESALASSSAVSPSPDEFLLIVRRIKETMNSTGRTIEGLPKQRHNICYLHREDLETLGVSANTVVRLRSRHGSVNVILGIDNNLRRGVMSMTHGYGGLPTDDDPSVAGTNPNRLLSAGDDLQSINAMPRMTAVPVTVATASAEV